MPTTGEMPGKGAYAHTLPQRVDVQRKAKLAADGFVLVDGSDLVPEPELKTAYQRFLLDWPGLPPDHDLTQVDRALTSSDIYRYRRYGRFRLHAGSGSLTYLPHAPFFQSSEYNQGAGGRLREFPPMTNDTATNEFLHEIIRWDFSQLPLDGTSSARWRAEWDIYVHQIRITSVPGHIGKPAPEGVHQDDVEFFAVHLLARENCSGGDSEIYDLDHRRIRTLRLERELDTLLVDDKRVLHGVVPIQALGEQRAFRDVLIISFRHLH